MPKMTHWNSPEPIDVPAEKAAVYAAQGWISINEPPSKVQPAMVRQDAAGGRPAPATRAPAKKPAKKAAKKS